MSDVSVAEGETRVEVIDVPAKERFEIRVDGVLAGFSQYTMRGDAIAFTHTETFPEFAGQGLASHLVRAELDEVRDRGMPVLPYCPFVRLFIARHNDYLDLVRPKDQARFEL